MINTYMRYSELIEITFEQTLKEAFDEYQVLNEYMRYSELIEINKH